MDFKTNIAYRKEMLIKLLNNVLSHENEIIDALYQDFKKPAFEAVLTETSYVVSELKDTIKNIKNGLNLRLFYLRYLIFHLGILSTKNHTEKY